MKHEKVLEKVYDRRRLYEAWQRVRRNAGAAGVDRMTVKEFESRKTHLLERIHDRLEELSYRFKPARRVLIPKEEPNKTRKLGIPVVMDRVVSQSINTVFKEIFEPEFTESNFGYREGKNQHKAIRYVRDKVAEGYRWCVSIDLKSFFDEIPHDLIFKLIRRKIADERLVTLIARLVKAGVVVDGKFEKTRKGCPQGSPLSPMISNIVLNELDQELERRGLKYSRWADDCIVLVKSERAAGRVLESVIRFIENDLKLPVNRDKSHASRINDVTFLGFQIQNRKIKISDKSTKKFKKRVKKLTRRNNPLSMKQIVLELNELLRGWGWYYHAQEFKCPLRNLDRWIRRRLRSMQLKKWKKPRRFQKVMITAGYAPHEAHQTWVKMSRWHSADRKVVRFVMDLKWFRALGLVFLHDFTLANLNQKNGGC
jgi:RNA-directed DNA polymerase